MEKMIYIPNPATEPHMYKEVRTYGMCLRPGKYVRDTLMIAYWSEADSTFKYDIASHFIPYGLWVCNDDEGRNKLITAMANIDQANLNYTRTFYS